MTLSVGDKVILAYGGLDFREGEVVRLTPRLVYLKGPMVYGQRYDRSNVAPWSDALWEQLQSLQIVYRDLNRQAIKIAEDARALFDAARGQP